MKPDLKLAMLRACQSYENSEAKTRASRLGVAELVSTMMAKGRKALAPRPQEGGEKC